MTYQIDCENDAFMIQSEDEHEVIETTRQHMHEKHDTEVDEDEVRDMMMET